MTRSNESSLRREFIHEYLTGLDCARSLAVWLLYENKEHQQLVALDFNPLFYNDLKSARDSLAATKLLSKATFLHLGIDKGAVALDTFFAAEEVCRKTNQRIRLSRFTTRETEPILFKMSQHISRILDRFDPEEFVDSCNFGPGATTSVKRRHATHPKKFGSENHITLDAYDFVKPWFLSAYPNWDVDFKIQGASKIVTVPKNAKTDRTIAIEPGINLWFQKGLGTMLRERLRRAGIDLNSQSINQERSRIAAKFNKLATVDFSSASDTISRELVYQLFPVKWYTLLDCFRSKYGVVKDRILTFEKFSSMGNGFTFELESLIFYSLALSITEYLGLSTSGITVFGDDVILPSRSIDLFSSVAADLGFTVNKAKSYSSSYYRESCGAHWWNGVDVKPIFLKEPLNGKAQTIKLANSVRRLARNRNSFGCDRRLHDCYRTLEQTLNGVARISDGYGDTGLIENFDHPSVVAVRAKHGAEGFHVKVWAPSPCMVFYADKGLWLTKLKANGDRSLDWWQHRFRPDLEGIGNDIPIPSRTRMAKVRLLIPRWAELGPWI